MSFNVLETAKSLLPDKRISAAALEFGETESNTRKAVKCAFPAVLAGLLHFLSRHDTMELSGLLKDVTDITLVKRPGEVAEPGMGSFSGGRISSLPNKTHDWLNQVFGPKLINIVNAISIFTDLKSSSSHGILHLVAPAALSSVATYATENKLGPEDIAVFLNEQKRFILAALPAGFNLTGSLGIDKLDDIGRKFQPVMPEPISKRKTTTPTSPKWIWLVLLLITFGFIAWFFLIRKNQVETPSVSIADSIAKIPNPVPSDTINNSVEGRFDSLSGTYVYDPGIITSLHLPDSSQLMVGHNSTEVKLYRVLADTSWSSDTTDQLRDWIILDRTYFPRPGSTLTSESRNQVKNIAAILKHYPRSQVGIGSFTDNEGDSLANKKLSEERAMAIAAEMKSAGLDSNQVAAVVGFGKELPLCPANNSPECKAKNRRAAIRVIKK